MNVSSVLNSKSVIIINLLTKTLLYYPKINDSYLLFSHETDINVLSFIYPCTLYLSTYILLPNN